MAIIKSIKRKEISDQRLYNLSVRTDESFICDGVVVHNCKSYLRANLKQNQGNPDVTGLPAISESAKKSITLGDK